jgi:threonine-phosphate decarboxylase
VSSGISVKQAQQHMGRQGILIRDASLFEGLNERYCRVAIRLREDNERLLQALSSMMNDLTRSGGTGHA